MDWKHYIHNDPTMMSGKACFAGTRVPVSAVLDSLASGATLSIILDEYPSLRPEHLPAAFAYAAVLVRERDKQRRSG